MATANTSQQFNPTLVITNAAGQPATVNGVPVWASSDATVISVAAAADGMSAAVPCVAPGTARITVSANADMDSTGVVIPITGVSEDIIVSADPAAAASVMTLTLGPAVAKTPPPAPGP
jgi:hypothetical protein